MADTIRMSLNAKLYISGQEVTTCKDVSLKITKSEAKLSNRLSPWEMVRGAMRAASFDVEFNDDSADPFLQTIINAFIANPATPLLCWILDAASGQGLRSYMEVMEMDDTQKLEDVVQYKFTFKPTITGYGGVYPSWS